jgi:hypothetical protein
MVRILQTRFLPIFLPIMKTDAAMSDNEENPAAGGDSSRRPNAKYNLSRRAGNDDQLIFYYNRERRLAKAPQSARDLYADTKPRRFSLFGPLIGSKPRAMLFGSIVFMCAAMLVLSMFGYFGKAYTLDGNRLTVHGAQYEGTVIITLKKSIPQNSPGAYNGAVDLAVTPAPAGERSQTLPVFYHRIFFSQKPEEEYQFTVPFDYAELILILQTEKSALDLKIKPARPPGRR